MANTAYGGTAAVGHTCFSISHNQDTPCTGKEDPCPLAEVLKRKDRFTVEHTHFTKTGAPQYVEIHAFPVFDTHGEVVQVIEYSLDITKNKTYEQEILLAKQTYKEIFDNISDALFIHDISTGEIVDVNNTMLRMYGYERREISHLTVTDLSAPKEIYSSERISSLIEKAAQGAPVVFEWQNRKKNGELFYSENVLKLVTIAGEDRIMAVVRDITEQKQAREALEESEAKLSALFSSMTEMVVLHELVFDEAGTPVNYRITDCNDAFTRITGIPREDAVGKLATEVYVTPEAPYLTEFAGVGITGEPYHYETYFAPMDKHFAISVVSPDKNRFATITSDISEAKEYQSLIAAKNKELEQLLYIASHDLRSPLVNVDGFSREIAYSMEDITAVLESTTERAPLEAALRREFSNMENSIEHIRTSAAQMDTLLKGILRLSRLGRAALKIEDVDMNTCLARLRESFAFVIQEADITLYIQKLPPCRGDAVQLTQVFSNLIDNAIKYRDPHRPLKITIDGEVEEHTVKYRIADTGIGIAENHRTHIFELFHRLSPETSDGEGLGLTLVQQMLTRLKGEIRVHSEVGTGSEFTVVLPRATTTP
ncbi:pas/pac sensor signal transduction histidine kinase [Chitinivibrio alkaliphilus ACht1]|uniref:histidine kinase n=2 Tax=Chitinivibrio TaxID=1505231 RepID=U7D8Z5_9BACT|nr:pas/pac sensor signal transduction histidine kinase [Chitinivibrio alkaliphilus ACht1]